MKKITSIRICVSSPKHGRSRLEIHAGAGCTDAGMLLMSSEWRKFCGAIDRAKHGTYIMLEIERSAK